MSHPLKLCYLSAFFQRLANPARDGDDELCDQLYADRRWDGFNQEVKEWKLYD